MVPALQVEQEEKMEPRVDHRRKKKKAEMGRSGREEGEAAGGSEIN